MSADLVADLLTECGLSATAAEGVRLTGNEQPFATNFGVVECAASALGAIGAVAALLHEERTGQRQQVTVNRGHAAASLVGFLFQSLDQGESPVVLERPLVALYRCADGRWVHLHGALPHLAARTVDVLGCTTESTKDEVAEAVARWKGLELEEALAEAGTCGAMARTVEEWADHPQAQAIAPLGRISIERIGDSEPEPVGSDDRPLGGLRVLDLSRILAAPTNGRTLAEHGAEVLLVNSPRLDNIDGFVMDTSHGKRSCHLELDDPADVACLRALAAGADVFSQGYRGGSLGRRGFSPEALAELRPGLVYVSISCYGDAGPWRQRPGWEQLAQTVSGMVIGQGSFDAPELLAAAACDYTTGYLAALGTMAALWRRAQVGGSYHVRVSLCQTAGWFTGAPAVGPVDGGFGDLAAYSTTTETPYGRLRHLAPVTQMSATPPHWVLPTAPIGTHDAAWAVEG